MKKTIVILMSLALMATVVGAAMARGGGPGYGMGPGYGKGPGQYQQLTPEQYAEMNKARAQFLKDTLELRQAMQAKRTELAMLYAQQTPDQAKIQALENEMIDLRSAIAKKANEAGISQGRGFGRGMGRGMGRGQGRGFCPGFAGGPGGGYGQGGGPCWR